MAQKFQTSLDETRLLMLASQILFGFQFQTVFQDQFATFTLTMRQVDASALLLMVVALALLLAPASQHRLVERGQITGRIRRAVTRYTEAALLPFSISFGLDIYLVFSHGFGEATGIAVGAAIFVLAILSWYVVEFVYREWILERVRDLDRLGVYKALGIAPSTVKGLKGPKQLLNVSSVAAMFTSYRRSPVVVLMTLFNCTVMGRCSRPANTRPRM